MHRAHLHACMLLVAIAPAFGAVTIGAGSSVDFADGSINLGCSDLTIAGQASATTAQLNGLANFNLSGSFAPGAASVTLGGNFLDSGTFLPGTSRVGIVDACGSGASSVSGATSFHDLIVASATGKALILPAGLTQTIAHALTLQGVAGNLLNVVSSTAGTRALLNVGSGTTQSIAYVNARDNNASGATIAPGAASSYNSIDGGNLLNWFTSAATVNSAVPAPALGSGRWVLLFGLLSAALWQLHRSTRLRLDTPEPRRDH